ncbi:MAG: methyltransferase family protein [Planctomycetota bacterium]
MSNPDLLLYGVHAAFWGSFWVTRSRAARSESAPAAPVAKSERTAPFSRAVMAVHMVAFFVMYFGVANAVLPNRVPFWFAGQRIVGSLVIATGAALMAWAVLSFRSWRFRAKLEEGHQLATEGPFRLLRHPIYMGMNLLALGTAIWAPSVIVWAGFALVALGSDLRARAEEPLLHEAFGPVYDEYCRRTKRFVPGIY